MREYLGDRLPKFSEEHVALLMNSVDFVGLNHYTSRFIAHKESSEENDFYKDERLERIGTVKSFTTNFQFVTTSNVLFSLTCLFFILSSAEWEGGEVIGEKVWFSCLKCMHTCKVHVCTNNIYVCLF